MDIKKILKWSLIPRIAHRDLYGGDDVVSPIMGRPLKGKALLTGRMGMRMRPTNKRRRRRSFL